MDFLNAIRDFFNSIAIWFMGLFGQSIADPDWVSAGITIGVLVVLLALVILVIVLIIKAIVKSKKKKAAKAKAKEEAIAKQNAVEPAAATVDKKEMEKMISDLAAKKVNEEADKRAEEDAKKKAAEEAKLKAEEEKKAAEEAKLKAEEERKAAEEAKAKAAAEKKAAEEEKKAAEEAKLKAEEERKAAEEAKAKAAAEKKAAAKKPAEKKVVVAPVPAAKKETKKAADKAAAGKWSIAKKADDEYLAILVASNGEVMLTSEIYSSEAGARNGIATIVKNVESGNFVIYQDKRNNSYFKLKTATNRLLCAGEIYSTKDACESAIESVKRIAKESPISQEIVEGKYIEYTCAPLNKDEISGAKGKWKIEEKDGKFSAKLYASNGQLMLSTEQVASRATAESAIESVKKNSADGNFIIDKDKSGRFYYKLRNNAKSIICIGESYNSLDGCTSALESVRRFANNSIIVAEEKVTAEVIAAAPEKPAAKKAPAKKK